MENKQDKMKALFDSKMNVKIHEFAVGDWVRIKKPGFLVKGVSKFGHPI